MSTFAFSHNPTPTGFHPPSIPAVQSPATSYIRPRDYQVKAIDACHKGWSEGLRRILLVLPTGAGKTVVFAMIIRDIIRHGGRVLVMAHRDELISQAESKTRDVLGPDADIGVVQGDRDESGAQVVIASVQTIMREGRRARLGSGFSLVVIDEAHHAAADTYREIIEALGCHDDYGPYLLGVTATADRGDGVGLDAIFEKIVFELPMIDLIEQGYLADIRATQVRLKADFNAELRTVAGDFVGSDVERVILDANGPEHVVTAYQKHAPGRRAIVFTSTIKVAEEMAAEFVGAGISAQAISGNTPRLDRRRILRDFAAGRIDVICNSMVLTEGFDCPPVDCIVIARPTKSRSLYQQMIGRGTRTHPGKSDCLVLDLVGSTTRHDLVTTASLFGLPIDALGTGMGDGDGSTVAEAVFRQRETDAGARVRGELVARTVSLFRSRGVNWLQIGDDRFVLSFGKGTIYLQECDQGWRLVLRPTVGADQVLATGQDVGYLQGYAEDYVRNQGGSALINPAARWRSEPISEKQTKMLRRLGLSAKGITTRGEASDLIGAAMARREAA